MLPAVVAGLLKAQAPDHADHRGFDLVEYDGMDGRLKIRCACSVDLTLTIPKTPDPTETAKAGRKGVDDGS